MYRSLLLPDLLEMLTDNDLVGMAEFCKTFYPGVTGDILSALPTADVVRVLATCDDTRRAEIFVFLPVAMQVEIVDLTPRESLSAMINEMAADDRVDLLELLDDEHVEALLPLMAAAERRDVRKLLSYPERSAGAIMTTEYAALPAGISVAEALEQLRQQAPNLETMYYVYIVGEDRHLQGLVTLRSLVLSKPNVRLADIIQRDTIVVRVTDDREDVAQKILRYDFLAIPVVDENFRLVGIVTHDDAADVLEDEAQEDQQRLAAVEPLQDTYLSTPVWTLLRKRGVWLCLLLFAAVFNAKVLQWFEGDSERGWILMFLPLVLATGGNVGSQTSTLVINALAREYDEFERRGTYRVILRESLLGWLLGISMGGIACVAALMLVGPVAAGIVGLTVLLVVLTAATLGAILPLTFSALDMDPAYMSTPLITALSDLMGIVVYFAAVGIALQYFAPPAP